MRRVEVAVEEVFLAVAAVSADEKNNEQEEEGKANYAC